MSEETRGARQPGEAAGEESGGASDAGGSGGGSGRSTVGAGGRTAGGEVEIAASPERVWRALTEAAELERWFPLEARVEPGEGGEIFMSWKNEYAGASRILVWDPPHHLRISQGAPEEGGAPAQVTDYHVEGRGGSTFLRVVTSGFPEDADWDQWVEGTRLGWRYQLRSLKHYLEEHEGRDREVIYLRRRIALSRSDAWERLFGPDGLGERPLGGKPFDVEPDRQYAAQVEDPPAGMLRVSLEPCAPGIAGRDVTLFLTAWGGHRQRMAELEAEWTALLKELFPEGETP